MYGIIYWLNNDRCFALTNDRDGTLWLIDTLKEADTLAELLEGDSYKLPAKIRINFKQDDEVEARVVNLEGVQ